MAGQLPPPGPGRTNLAGPGVPNTPSTAKVRGAPTPIQTIQQAAQGVPADVFQTFRGVRDAMLIHCPAGLNHAIHLARSIRTVTS